MPTKTKTKPTPARGLKRVPASERRESSEGRGRPLSQDSIDLLAGETLLADIDLNPGNFDKTMKAHGFRLRTQLHFNKRGAVDGRLLWAEKLEPAKRVR